MEKVEFSKVSDTEVDVTAYGISKATGYIFSKVLKLKEFKG